MDDSVSEWMKELLNDGGGLLKKGEYNYKYIWIDKKEIPKKIQIFGLVFKNTNSKKKYSSHTCQFLTNMIFRPKYKYNYNLVYIFCEYLYKYIGEKNICHTLVSFW